MFRKCNSFKDYGKPTEQELEYISKVAYEKYEFGAMIVILFLMTSLIMVFVGMELLSRLYDGEALLENGLYVLVALFMFIIILTIRELAYYADVKRGRYTLLEGIATYYSYYSRRTYDATRDIKRREKYYHAIKDFTSLNGERDKISFVLKVPRYARVKDWNDGKDFPILLVKVKGTVRYAIPDWSVIPTHPKYNICKPLYFSGDVNE